jgi:beta-N-acetylhexosaminidase
MQNPKNGRLMLDLQGVQLTQQERLLLLDPHVGGVILFARNMQSQQQLLDLVAEIRSQSPHILIAVDQEGGRVQRFKEGFTRLPAMQHLADTLIKSHDPSFTLLRDTGWLMASEVIACGLDISFAPVLDVDRDTSSIIGDRAFSDQPQLVVRMARAFIEGMAEAGMACTGKHFPGHGGISADSHLEAPVDKRTMADLMERDLVPFAQLNKLLNGIMTAHITFPNVDHHSVGFSRYWIQQILRQQLNFDGVVFSDDLTMKGADVAGGFKEKAQQALAAGCDMILVCNCPEGAREVLEYMHRAEVDSCQKIQQMRAKKSITWQQLTQQSRYDSIRDKLEKINRTGG